MKTSIYTDNNLNANGAQHKVGAFSWLRNPHLLTVLPLLKRESRFSLRQQAYEALIPVDKESVLLAKCHLQKEVRSFPTLLLVHGLEGSSESPYILRLAGKALDKGFNVVRLNLRNCGNTLHLSPRLYNAGSSEDLLLVIDWLVERQGHQEIFLIGYSLGGNLVLKTGAELDSRPKIISGICAISPSVDLAKSVAALDKGFNQVYQYKFLWTLKNKILRKAKLFPARYDARKLDAVKTIRIFDDLYTAPDGGWKDAASYYREASSLQLINGISLPSLIITAKDDPLVPFESFQKINNKLIKLIAPNHGGHVGLMSRTENNCLAKSRDLFWTDEAILEFCLSHMKAAKWRD